MSKLCPHLGPGQGGEGLVLKVHVPPAGSKYPRVGVTLSQVGDEEKEESSP